MQLAVFDHEQRRRRAAAGGYNVADLDTYTGGVVPRIRMSKDFVNQWLVTRQIALRLASDMVEEFTAAYDGFSIFAVQESKQQLPASWSIHRFVEDDVRFPLPLNVRAPDPVDRDAVDAMDAGANASVEGEADENPNHAADRNREGLGGAGGSGSGSGPGAGAGAVRAGAARAIRPTRRPH